jgi:hypothetical protein
MRVMHLARATRFVCQHLIPLIESQRAEGLDVFVCAADGDHVNSLEGQWDQGLLASAEAESQPPRHRPRDSPNQASPR